MAIFSWIVLGFVALLLLLSGLCWLLTLLLDDSRWTKLGGKLFRFAMVAVLFYVNGVVWGHIIGSLI